MNFWELPPKRTFVVFSELYTQAIHKMILDLAGDNVTKAARLVNIQKNFLYHLKCGKHIRVDKLLKLLNFLSVYDSKFSLTVAQKHVIWIGPSHGRGIYNPHLPVNLQDPAFVRTAARACGDGMVTKIYALRHGYGSLLYFAKEDPEQLQNAITDAITSFGGNVRTYKVSLGRDVYLAYPTVIRDILLAVGVLTSPKAESKCGVPEFVMKSGREAVWAAWLQQTSDDEGHVVYHPQHNLYGIYWRRSEDLTAMLDNIKLKAGERVSFHRLPDDIQKQVVNHPPKILLDEQELLNRLGITSTLTPLEIYRTHARKLRVKWQLRISGPNNLIQFGRKIGFQITRKSVTLAKVMEQCLNYEKSLLPILNGLQLKHGYIDAAMISMKLGGSLIPHSNRVTIPAIVALREMSRRGYICKIEDWRYIKKSRTSVLSRYVITEKGYERYEMIQKEKEEVRANGNSKRLRPA